MNPVATPLVEHFHHAPTGTITYLVRDPAGRAAAIIDPVLDYDPAAARTSTFSVDAVLARVRGQQLDVQWILETHAHADHLSAAGYLHDVLGAPVGIGRGIIAVQRHFSDLFGWGETFAADGSDFDRLFDDGDCLALGSLQVQMLATPGHTVDGMTYCIGDAAFIGDTLFAPASGTARTDFPGGDAAQLHASIRRLLALPAQTRLFLCHDYPDEGKPVTTHATVAEQAVHNVHVGGEVAQQDFIARRRRRDSALPVPRLILPALQVNLRGGRLPPAEGDGVSYLRIPLNRLGAGS